jgi:hypothetical protein
VRLDDISLYNAECVLLVVLLAAYAGYLLLHRLRAARPSLNIATPLLVGFLVRVLAAVGVTLTPLAQSLRGGDELAFLSQSHALAATSLTSAAWTDALTGSLYKWVFALQIRAFDAPELALRITQVTITMAGLMLMAAAVYDLAGRRAARIAAWVLALEPASIFFSSLLHKEPLMYLAEGLVVFGGVQLWRRGRPTSLLPMAAGCLIAVATRRYAGWFLIAAAAAIALHSAARGSGRNWASSGVLILAVAGLAIATTPTVLQATTPAQLKANLQSSQDANASDASNLKLERVDFSSRGAVIGNLPQRIADIVTRPYPWQVANTSQQLGVLGTLVALLALGLGTAAAIRRRGHIFRGAGPFLHVAFAMLIAYALSAGNAGTAYRYRTHVVVLALCAVVVLRSTSEKQRAPESGALPLGSPAAPSPIALTSAARA